MAVVLVDNVEHTPLAFPLAFRGAMPHAACMNLLWKNELRAMLKLALPLIATNITYILINATDVFLLGHYSVDAMAAAQLSSSFMVTLMLIGVGLITSVPALISKERGGTPHSVRAVRAIVQQGLWVSVLISVPICASLWFTGDLMLWLGQPPKLAAAAGQYMRAIEWQLPCVFLLNTFRNFLASLERPLWSVVIGYSGVAVNAVLNTGLIFGYWGLPRMGLVGAGIGTSVLELLMLLAMLVVVRHAKPFRRYHVLGRLWQPNWHYFTQIWRVGVPISLQMVFEAGVFNLSAFLMGYFSVESVAANGIAFQAASMTFMVPMGLAQAATVRVGLGFGAQDKAAVRLSGQIAYMLGLGFMCGTALLLALFPEHIARLFLDAKAANTAQVIALAVPFIRMAALFQIFDGAQVVGISLLRGLSDTRIPMIMAFLGYWGAGIGLGIFLAFPLHWQGLGLWVGLALGLACVALGVAVRWRMRERLGIMRF
jgi:multidrug resistance protein, MATE family